MQAGARQTMWNGSSFTELQYIQSTGTQRISTLKPLSSDDTNVSTWYSRIDMEFTTLPSGTEKMACGVYYGGLAVRNSNTYRVFYITSSGGGAWKDVSISNRLHVILTFTGQDMSLYSVSTDETLASASSAYLNCSNGGQSGDKYNLFAGFWNERTAFDYQQVKIYDFKIGPSENSLAMHLRPALDKNGIVCMYDLVSKAYVYNEGTGDFIAGPTLASSMNEGSALILFTQDEDYWKEAA